MLATKIFSAIVALTFLNGSFACTNPAVVDLILLNFYITVNQHQVYNVHNFHQLVNHASFRHDRDLVIYYHGFSQTLQTPSVADVIDAYVHYGNVNVVFVNFASVATHVGTNICTIGENIASALVRLFDDGFSPSRVHLVGFSLGGMGAGIIAREVQIQSGDRYTIERLTALDHATPPAGEHRITSDFARFVETIFTSAVADTQALGHANYFPNSGLTQPHCSSPIATIEQTCSHLFAVVAWVESIRAQTAVFPSLQCASWEHFQRNECTPGVVGHMGVHTSPALRGSFFLSTNLEAPFSRPVPGP